MCRQPTRTRPAGMSPGQRGALRWSSQRLSKKRTNGEATGTTRRPLTRHYPANSSTLPHSSGHVPCPSRSAIRVVRPRQFDGCMAGVKIERRWPPRSQASGLACRQALRRMRSRWPKVLEWRTRHVRRQRFQTCTPAASGGWPVPRGVPGARGSSCSIEGGGRDVARRPVRKWHAAQLGGGVGHPDRRPPRFQMDRVIGHICYSSYYREHDR
jgi:hypothetical protein